MPPACDQLWIIALLRACTYTHTLTHSRAHRHIEYICRDFLVAPYEWEKKPSTRPFIAVTTVNQNGGGGEIRPAQIWDCQKVDVVPLQSRRRRKRRRRRNKTNLMQSAEMFKSNNQQKWRRRRKRKGQIYSTIRYNLFLTRFIRLVWHVQRPARSYEMRDCSTNRSNSKQLKQRAEFSSGKAMKLLLALLNK